MGYLKFLLMGVGFFLVQYLSASPKIIFSESLYQQVQSLYGSKAVQRVKAWQHVIESNISSDVEEQLYQVNHFFNQLTFVDDIQHWDKADYWATPVEFLATNGGDCEDFSIAKYFSLRALGIPTEKLRLMYVTALNYNQAHMVLAYYPSPNAIPLVLDNINPTILPANQRADLAPVYSFNGDGLWMAKAQGQGKKLRSGGNNSLWDDLNKRIEQGN